MDTAPASGSGLTTLEPDQLPVAPPQHGDGPTTGSPPPAEPRQGSRPARALRPRLARAAPLLVVALVSGVTGSAATRVLDDERADPAGAGAATPAPLSRSLRLDGETLDVASVVAKAGPAVAAIHVDYGRPGGGGAGTGVVLTPEGEILTNAHVVDGASTVRVTLAGESQARSAQVVGTDRAADLALLRIPGASRLATAALGRSS